MTRTQGRSAVSAAFLFPFCQPLVSSGCLIRTSVVIKQIHWTTEHSEHPQGGMHLGYSRNTDPGIALGNPSWRGQRSTGGSGFAAFSLADSPAGRKGMHDTYSLPETIPLQYSCQLWCSLNGYRQRTLWTQHNSECRSCVLRKNPDDHQDKQWGRDGFLCDMLEWQEVNGSLKSNNTKLG